MNSQTEGEKPIFVIQKHDASQLHYDFRLELNGTLTSWAVPKGPSLDPKERRLAIQVADHPICYADFEGTITEGNYGAGEVIVWDTGTYTGLKEYRNTKKIMDAYQQGHMEVWLTGYKLHGGFALSHMQQKRGHWLLIKMNDAYANRERDILADAPNSVLTNRTIAHR